MGVLIDNRQTLLTIEKERIQSRARAVLNALDSPDGELSILIVDDQEIAELNEEYLHRKGPTNVIAFPMQEGEFSRLNPFLLGDVVVSVETAAREGEAAGLPLEERMDELLVHGILHLFGFDHEQTEKEARKMEEKTLAMMTLLANLQD